MENKDKNPFENIQRVSMTPEEKARMRQNLISYMQANPKIERGVETDKGHSFFSFVYRSQRVLAVLVVLAGFVGLLSAADSAKPGDGLYAVKYYLSDPINSLFNRDSNTRSSDFHTIEDSLSRTTIVPAVPESLEVDSAGFVTSELQPKRTVTQADYNEGLGGGPGDVTPPISQANESYSSPTSFATYSAPVSISNTGATVLPRSARIRVVAPDRYDSYEEGETIEIRWENALDTRPIDIYMHKDRQSGSDTFWSTKIGTVPASVTGSHTWTLQYGMDPGFYYIKMYNDGEVVLSGESERFEVRQARSTSTSIMSGYTPDRDKIKIISPNVYSVLNKGNTYSIVWENNLSNDWGRVVLHRSRYQIDSPDWSKTIGTFQSSNSGSIDWTVSQDIEDGYYYLEFEPNSSKNYGDFSEEFAIISDE